MKYTEYISNKSILGIIERVCSYVDPRLMDHGMRVSYLVWKMLAPLGTYSREALRDICFLSILHDIGAYKTEEINRMIDFETDHIWEHSIYGYLFMRCFSPLESRAGVVLLHHITWDVLQQQEEVSDEIKEIAQVLFLADRIDVSMEVEQNSWEKTLEIVRAGSGTRFSPAAVALAETLTITLPLEEAAMADTQYYHTLSDYLLTHAQITDYLKMIIFSIDFRSRHTVTHTVTTTSISAEIAGHMGLDEDICNQIVCGALLHDIGKIGIPVEILEYPAVSALRL
ncbi:HD domain-containing protein [Clostridium sp. AM58-1XD]|uniref:HD domain-containing protein n=1 Tax=Clostridium sp. AM58-1XD TaxID=2292307 RepID=UPI001FA8A279|nr:HD domain-containing protein [Clostridium sp. AM58-1XD]